MKRIVSSLFSILLFSGIALAQPAIKFTKESHDFGEVIEGKLASYEFEITNSGDAPLIINNVQASCGCTSPHWTKEPIMPGKTGIIKATYNSAGRPGAFNKSLTIVSNAGNGSKTVFIKGAVVKREDKVYTEEEKKKSAKIVIEKGTYKIGKLEINQPGTAKVLVSNKGINPLEIDNVTSPCNCTTFRLSKASIAAGETATLEITYSPKQKGVFKEEVTISSSDIATPNFRIYIEGEALESFSPNGMKEGAGNSIFK